ncbi:MAG: PhoU domain-containing protein [Candidatus Neomarinimicrobiota bacterium]
MAIFDRVISLWKSEDLLSQAWEDSFQMMVLSNEMFSAAIRYLRRGEKIKTLKNLKKRDREINEFQKSVRKKVVTHFSVSRKVEDFPSGLVLLNIVVDVERLGDYTKNILDLAIHYPDPLVSEDCLISLKEIEDDIQSRFADTLVAIEKQDEKLAKKLLKSYRKSFSNISDKIVNNGISGKQEYKDQKEAAAVTLYARYLKRVGGHLKNITTTMINPYEEIGYRSID